MKNIYKLTLKIDTGAQVITLNSKEKDRITKERALEILEHFKKFIDTEFKGDQSWKN